MHLRRRVRNARNNHRTRDDVGWIIPEDAECTRSPDSGGFRRSISSSVMTLTVK